MLWGFGVQKREESYRLYSCRGCSVLVSICGRRDHGNIFCAGECAGAPYQRTRRGGGRHAARQQAWRDRELEKVTQQGCAPAGPVFTISITVAVAAIEHQDEPAVTELLPALPPKRDRHRQHQAGRCDFCHALLPVFTRLRTRCGWGFG